MGGSRPNSASHASCKMAPAKNEYAEQKKKWRDGGMCCFCWFKADMCRPCIGKAGLPNYITRRYNAIPLGLARSIL